MKQLITYTLSAILLVYAFQSVPPPPKGQTALGLECFEVAGKWYDGNGDQIEADECRIDGKLIPIIDKP